MSAEIVSIATKLTVIEFDCADCNQHVVSFCPWDHEPICGTCRFIREYGTALDEETKHRLRFPES